METTGRISPLVEDPDVAAPRVSHIRSTPWGQAWPVDAPALCGARPQQYWLPTRWPSTCLACLQVSRASLAAEVEGALAQFRRTIANLERLQHHLEDLQASEPERRRRKRARSDEEQGRLA
jgi:hypothetical protein